MQAEEYEAITVSSTPIGFTSTKIEPVQQVTGICKEVFCVVEDDDIRFTLDGTTPSDTVGTPLLVGENLTLDSIRDIERFKAHRVTSDASLKCIFRF